MTENENRHHVIRLDLEDESTGSPYRKYVVVSAKNLPEAVSAAANHPFPDSEIVGIRILESNALFIKG